MKQLIIIGNGKLAEAIKTGIYKYSNRPVNEYGPAVTSDVDSVFVHVGSGRQYDEALKKAAESGSSFIQASTGGVFKMDPPVNGTLKFIHAPNLDLHIIKLFYWLKLGKGLFANENISVTESHQQQKKSVAGTAVKICDYLKIPHEKLVSIRDPEQQKLLGIRNLDHHAYHRIDLGDDNSSISIQTKIEGAESYVKGLAKIVECICGLEVKNYEIDDLVEMGLL